MKSVIHKLRFNPLTVSCLAFLVGAGRYVSHYLQLAAVISLVSAQELFNHCGMPKLKLRYAITAEEETRSANAAIMKSLEGINTRLSKVDEIEKQITKNKEDYEAVTKLMAEVQKSQVELQKQILATRSARIRRGGEVSNECASFLGAIGLIAALKTPGADIKPAQREMAETQIKNILGIEAKAALTSSDIPLPTVYSGEIVEFVYEFGQARKIGTVFPLGAGTVKLPKLGTDTTFALIASSGTVTEKSPTISFVTFTAEKFGGLIRLPEEIDEDSIVAMGQFLARYASRQIAQCEDYQFFRSTGAGSGVNGTGPGLLTAAVTDSCVYSLGGTTTGGKTSISQAVLADFRNLRSSSTLSGIVLNKAKYYMHPTFEALLVSFNTSATVQPYQRANGTSPAMLDGFEIVWV